MADFNQSKPNRTMNRRLYELCCGYMKLFIGALPAPGKKIEIEWSELSPDLLRLIAKKLGDISNFVRFRVVCKQWRSAVSPLDLPPQLPWLLEGRLALFSSDINFYSLYSNQMHTLRVPEAEGLFVYVTTKSYLLLKDLLGYTSIFINPLTRHNFRNPDLNGPVHVRELLIAEGWEDNIRVAILTREISRTYKYKTCSYLQTEGTDSRKEWMKVQLCCGNDGPITFYKGNLLKYFYETMDTKVFDIRTGDILSTIPGKLIAYPVSYLINAYDDLLLGVVVENYYSMIIENWRYKVYRLEQGKKTRVWTEMSQGIGDLILFIDNNGGFCLKASDFDGLKGNKIYFHRRMHGKFYLGMYDLEKATTKLLMGPTEGTEVLVDPIKIGAWFVPSL